MTKLSIIIPTLNEEKGILNTLQAIPREELVKMGYEVEVIVIDGVSGDSTKEIARNAGANVIIEPKLGYGRAYKIGFAQASGEIIVTADADHTYPVEDIPALLDIFNSNQLQFLTTNRFAYMTKDAMSAKHRVGNTILSLEVKLLYGLNMRDPESGMWIFQKKILDDLKVSSNYWPFSHELKIEACFYSKCRWQEIGIKYRGRAGKSKITSGWAVGFWDLFHIFQKRFVR